MKKVLVTRPFADAIITSKKINRLGFITTICPLIILNRRKHSLDSSYNPDVLIFSSKNSVRFFKYVKFKRKMVFCIGEGTYKELKQNKYQNIVNVDGNAKKILEKFNEKYGKKKIKVLHPCGTNIISEFKKYFSMQESEYLQLPVYTLDKKNMEPYLFYNFFKDGGKIVLLFSQLTAESFVESFYKHKLQGLNCFIQILAMSKNISNYLKKYNFKNLIVPKKPNEQCLIRTLKEKI